MVFDKRAFVLELRETAPQVFRWEKLAAVWVKTESQAKPTLFSKSGTAERAALIRMNARRLTLHQAIAIGGSYFFPTEIKRDGILYLEITAAQIISVECRAFRMTEVVGADKEAHFQPVEIARFPACLAEKYQRFTQNEPMAQTETAMILVTPKRITLAASDLIEIADVKFAVRLCHELDEYRNEYEIYRRTDC